MNEPTSEQSIFLHAIALGSPAERVAYLDAVCRDNPKLRAELDALLAAHNRLGGELPITGPEHAGASFSEGPPAVAFSETAGTVIGAYKLIEQIGEGGMGTVWMAQQTEPIKRLVALKLIKAGMDSRQVIARFEAERQALALMDHANIARVLDAGTTSAGRPYFVMDLVKGMTITKYCDEHHLTPRQRLELFIPVCQAIQHAHQKGVIHRDLKPSNVLIALYDGRPMPKVIDFGVAKATGQTLTDKTLITGFGAIVGTLEYMSPEQAEINQLDIDTRSDIYSLGVLLYELLTGSPPFSRKDLEKAGMLEMLRVIREQEPSKPSMKLSTAEGLPTLAANRGTEPARLTKLVRGELDWIVMKALEKDRNRRYETANGFAADVQRYLNDEPVLACPPSAWYRLGKFARRYQGAVLAASLLFLTLVLGIIGTSFGLVLAEQARQDEVGARLDAEEEARAKESARAAEAAQRVIADANRVKAEQAAEAEAAQRIKADDAAVKEKQAREQAEKRLAQIEKGVETIGAIFKDLHPNDVEKQGRSLQVILGERLDATANQLESDAIGDPLAVARLQHILGISLRGLGFHDKATVVLGKALQTREKLLPPDHRETLSTMNYLAEAYHDAGKLDLAMPLYVKTMAKRRAKLSRNHPDTLLSMNNLALAYHDQGKLELAIILFEETLEKRRLVLGPANLHTLITMNNLAGAYLEAGKLELALELYVEALEKTKTARPPDHPETIGSMINLATAYEAAGKVEKALPLFLDALERSKTKLGPDHPSTLSCMNNLATLYKKMGKIDLAMPLFLETFEKMKTKRGPDHPDVLTCMSNVAEIYLDAGKLDLAQSLHLETLTKRKAKLPPDHPQTLRSMNHLALAYREGGKVNLALPLLEETLKKRQAQLGLDHPDTIQSMSNLALMYHDVGKRDLALELYLDALEKAKAKLSVNHPQTLRIMHNLGEVYFRSKKHDLAIPLLEETLAKKKATQSPDHPDTLSTMHALAVAYHEVGKVKLALELNLETLKKRKVVLSADHQVTLVTMSNLAHNYYVLGDFGHALPLMAEAAQKLKAKLGPDHPMTQISAKNLSSLLNGVSNRAIRHFGEKEFADAEALLALWLETQRPRLLATHIDLAFHLNVLGECQVMQKRYDAAEKALRESLTIYEKKLPKAVMRHDTESLLGAALAGQKKYDDAEPLLINSAKELLATYAKLSSDDRVLARAAAQRVIEFYGTWHRPEDAAKWRKQLAEVKKIAK
jgi:serine/threonine protein kinase